MYDHGVHVHVNVYKILRDYMCKLYVLILSETSSFSLVADGYNPEDPSLTAGANPPPLPPPPLLPHQIPPLRPAFPPPIPPIPRLPHIPPIHSNPPPTIPSAFTPVSCQAPPIAPPTR